MKEHIELVASMAFDAIDVNGDKALQEDEIATVLRDVALELKVPPPSDAEVSSILEAFDENDDKEVSKSEFNQMIMRVLTKMREDEKELQEGEEE